MATNSDKLIFTEVKERLKDQFDSIESMDRKAEAALGFIGAMLAALPNFDWFASLPYYFLIPILALTCSVAIFALKSFLVKDYRKDPEPSSFIEGYKGKKESETLGVLIRNFEDSFNKNKKPIEEKKKNLNRSFILFAVTLIVISVVFVISSLNAQSNRSFNWEREVIKHGRYR